jgi:cell division septum initiation protein DivIVA
LEELPETSNEQSVSAPPASPSEAEAKAATRGLLPSFKHDSLPGGLFGYRRGATRSLLADLDELFRELWEELVKSDGRIRELELEVREHELEVDRRREREWLISQTLITAQQEAQAIEEKARRSAEVLLEAARKQAETIPEQAELEAKANAKEIVEAAERTRARLLDEAGRARAFVDETHGQLSDFLLAAVKWYENAKLSLDGEREEADEPAIEEPR